MRIRRLVTVTALAAAMVGSAATTSSAKPAPDDGYLTATKYDTVSIGMTKQQVEGVIGTRPHCSGSGNSLTCWTSNTFVDQTATFTFDDGGRLYRKEKNGPFAYGWYTYDKPRTMTREQYDRFAEGDSLAEVNAVVDGTACTDMWVEYPGYPSSDGWKTAIQCTGTVEESYPTIDLFFTDGRLTSKSYWSRDSGR